MTEQEAIFTEQENAIFVIQALPHKIWEQMCQEEKNAIYMAISALEKQMNGGWIKVTWHETTDDDGIDKEQYPICLDCKMPDDEQEILVCSKKYVWVDTCCIDDCYSLDSGNDWIEDIVAWQPLPEPYKAGEDNE